MKRMVKFLGLGLLGVILSVGLGFVIWAETPLGPMPEALAALQSDDRVTVEITPWLTFAPVDTTSTVGFVLYPGGRVDPRSYAPAAREIAAAGYLVVIPPMPFNLAVFATERATEVIAAYPEITRWVVGGHSLGGAMAARFVARHPDAVDGLALWASYPPDSLADWPDPVLMIYGPVSGPVSRWVRIAANSRNPQRSKHA